MGGEIAKSRMLCDYLVYFLDKGVKVMHLPNKRSKDVHFKFITESYFNWTKLDEADYEVNRA